ncbi:MULTISPECIES: aldehyde dehydrogenase family protein [Pseudomonas]|uniref:aldehyde dehydrogenase family protein n=1 Tax=Pseudomonas TaxID=286 RepID=UPI001C303B05|nr:MULTISPECIES: aldehyde dehydrogenase family protein [Pseudomonas]MBV2079638.1 aldehyde dehydrogenase family protein [Pseudomonas carnis]MBV2085392.1 aldehyde dehydrogenase family protein [Pseudomonas carnis]MDO3689366.1 aldehyde dehydrogenase family protein [Pseudomonas sp. DKN 2791]MDO7031249.1 aldehyde dehydrogenase family protein [Pseudomonas sp. DKN 2792]
MNSADQFKQLPERVRDLGHFINGKKIEAGHRKTSERVSPGFGHAVTRTTLCTPQDVEDAVNAARAAERAGVWSRVASSVRAGVLLKTAALVREHLEELAYWEMLESGKPISQAKAEMGGVADHFEFAAGAARTLHGEAFNNLGEDMLGIVTRQPVGVVGVITPWNFPLIVLAERVPYILASGNSVVIKPSEMTSATTVMIAEIMQEAGLPNGVFNVVTGSGSVVGQLMAEHMDIDMISFTGSTAIGAKVLAASCSNFKKAALELGGKNPQIVFADADLDDAADGVAFGLCFNAGQCCVSGSRLIVEASVAAEFQAKLVEKLSRVKIGDCFDPETQMGAIASEDHQEKIFSYVELAKTEGAEVVTGGHPITIGKGRFMAPTLLTGMNNSMRVAQEEIFGPVLAMITFTEFDEALQIANDSPYGLAASIWTKDIDKGLRAMRQVEAGRTWINTTIAGGPELPTGGFKQSGTGRETGVLGIEEYTEVKSTHIAIGKRNHWVK